MQFDPWWAERIKTANNNFKVYGFVVSNINARLTNNLYRDRCVLLCKSALHSVPWLKVTYSTILLIMCREPKGVKQNVKRSLEAADFIQNQWKTQIDRGRRKYASWKCLNWSALMKVLNTHEDEGNKQERETFRK